MKRFFSNGKSENHQTEKATSKNAFRAIFSIKKAGECRELVVHLIVSKLWSLLRRNIKTFVCFSFVQTLNNLQQICIQNLTSFNIKLLFNSKFSLHVFNVKTCPKFHRFPNAPLKMRFLIKFHYHLTLLSHKILNLNFLFATNENFKLSNASGLQETARNSNYFAQCKALFLSSQHSS